MNKSNSRQKERKGCGVCSKNLELKNGASFLFTSILSTSPFYFLKLKEARILFPIRGDKEKEAVKVEAVRLGGGCDANRAAWVDRDRARLGK